MSSRFLVSSVTTFLGTLTVLLAVGYAVTQLVVRQPRDPFRTGSFEFDLAPGWECEHEGTEYVCSPPGASPHAAIAVIATKERDKADNLQAYEDHLRQPSHRASDLSNSSGAESQISEIIYVKRRILGSKEWVEALHLGSEMPDYYTYYLATTTSFNGILVTMSVLKGHEIEYTRQINEMMSTLNVYQR